MSSRFFPPSWLIRQTRGLLAALGMTLFCVSGSVLADYPGLAEFWAGKAHFVEDQHNFVVPYRIHFLSAWWKDSLLYVYHVYPYEIVGSGLRFGVALAVTSDGVHFEQLGLVLSAGQEWEQFYPAAESFAHQTGAVDGNCAGWSGKTAIDEPGYLLYGLPFSNVSSGAKKVLFPLTIDDNTSGNEVVATIDILDHTVGKILSFAEIERLDFSSPMQESVFALEYFQEPGHRVEFRTFFHQTSYLCQRGVGLLGESPPLRDERIASFAGVWVDGGTWYMVYEGSSFLEQGVKGEIRLATSRDGIYWTRYPQPIVVPSADWQQENLGTPSLWKTKESWYVFYHAYDGQRVRLGASIGASLLSLSPANGNSPVLEGDTGWDEGTIGKRSIIKQGDFYYMVYEGSTAQHPELGFSGSRWSIGLARSRDLLHWEKYPNNPILAQTRQGFGNDGPEFIKTPDGLIHIYYRQSSGGTTRLTLH